MADASSLSRFTLSSSVPASDKARNRKVSHSLFTPRNTGRSVLSFANSSSGDVKNQIELDVKFPRDYSQLLEQAKAASELAFKDGKQLLEIEFPTSGLESVPGDGEGGIEMTECMQLIRVFVDRFIAPEKFSRTRIV